jgi:hypothetical protein
LPPRSDWAYSVTDPGREPDPDEKRWANDTGGEFTSKALADYGAVEKSVPFDQWATTKFVDAARQKLGPYKAG